MTQSYRAAVIGDPVTHSLSPVLHRAAYEQLGLDNWTYEAITVTAQQLPQMLAQLRESTAGPQWAGLSVTMPHKQQMFNQLDFVDPLAQVTGAVNTVVVSQPQTGAAMLAGFNTDVAGIVGALREVLAPGERPAKAVVLGAGATACSALAALTQLEVSSICVAARNHAGPHRVLAAAHRMGIEIEPWVWNGNQEALAALLAQAEVVISTVPKGVSDPVAAALTGSGAVLNPAATLLDVVYSPWPTQLAKAWQKLGGRAVSGHLMLLHQAEPQVRLMTGKTPSLGAMREALEQALAQRV